MTVSCLVLERIAQVACTCDELSKEPSLSLFRRERSTNSNSMSDTAGKKRDNMVVFYQITYQMLTAPLFASQNGNR